jgi:ketosteroid isomerase-like protein
MSSDKVQTVLDYFKATEEHEREGVRQCLGPGYTFVDHGADRIARSAEDLREELAQFRAWSNVRYVIENAVVATDGSVVVQAMKSGNVNGTFRSMVGTGQNVSYPICDILRFDDDGRIVYEEAYYDLLGQTTARLRGLTAP